VRFGGRQCAGVTGFPEPLDTRANFLSALEDSTELLSGWNIEWGLLSSWLAGPCIPSVVMISMALSLATASARLPDWEAPLASDKVCVSSAKPDFTPLNLIWSSPAAVFCF
jgi:hypothetical protein